MPPGILQIYNLAVTDIGRYFKALRKENGLKIPKETTSAKD